MVYIHGLDVGTDNKLYNTLWIPFIQNATRVIANNSPTYDICTKKVKQDRAIIHPGDYPKNPNVQLIQQFKNNINCMIKILISIGT